MPNRLFSETAQIDPGDFDKISALKSWFKILKNILRRIVLIATKTYAKFKILKCKLQGSIKRSPALGFPAVHIGRLDLTGMLLKLSGEILVLFLTLLISGLSVFYFYGTDYSDNSHMAYLLKLHPDQNRLLYQKNTTLSTVVLKGSSLLSQAQAEEFFPMENNNFGADEQEPEMSPIMQNDGAIVQPNPDSVSGLIAKQIKVYVTVPGDSLKIIANNNGISINTLMWANKLNSTVIKPGWYLIILPVDGILHKATANDTLPDLVKKYPGSSLETIISYNGLENAEDIEPGQLIIVPGGTIPQPAPKPKTPADGKVKPNGTSRPLTVNNGTGHIFPWGYCTWYVATRLHIPWGGNAKNWLENASRMGYAKGKTPAVGSIVVTTDNRRWGHVAFVERVDGGAIFVSEMNFEKFGRVNTRSIPITSKSIRGYIYP